jgi:hypothetical protein
MPRGSLRRRLGRLTLALGCTAALWACNAPFIPVPPPAASFTSQALTDASGAAQTAWTTHGHAGNQAASARFFIYDNEAANGVIIKANPDGSYDAPPFDGTANDHVYIYYQDDAGENSELVCRLLMDSVDPAPLCPP